MGLLDRQAFIVGHIDVCDVSYSLSDGRVLLENDIERTQMAYANRLAEYADAGGYDHEVVWDTCCQAALGLSFEKAQWRRVNTKRLRKG